MQFPRISNVSITGMFLSVFSGATSVGYKVVFVVRHPLEAIKTLFSSVSDFFRGRSVVQIPSAEPAAQPDAQVPPPPPAPPVPPVAPPVPPAAVSSLQQPRVARLQPPKEPKAVEQQALAVQAAQAALARQERVARSQAAASVEPAKPSYAAMAASPKKVSPEVAPKRAVVDRILKRAEDVVKRIQKNDNPSLEESLDRDAEIPHGVKYDKALDGEHLGDFLKENISTFDLSRRRELTENQLGSIAAAAVRVGIAVARARSEWTHPSELMNCNQRMMFESALEKTIKVLDPLQIPLPPEIEALGPARLNEPNYL